MKPEAVVEKRKDKIPYEYYKKELAKTLPSTIEENTGLIYNEEKSSFTVKLMTDEYSISYPGGEVKGPSENIKYSLKTLLLRYLINSKGVKPAGKMIHYRDVPDGNIYYANFYGRCIMRLAKTFKNKPDLLDIALQKIGGEKIDTADISYKIPFLHNIYVYVLYWRGDDEFPASAQILFSDNVEYYFSAEDLAFVGDIVNDYLLKAIY
ncbi:DUF3786 domain-containing protein [Alkalibacter mobilis]|uniref:DUF3786 domain-containing protein n=1 Tax=Alkalibacter mobilis TaxID=2787712 RepID=UPI00189FA16E|nr:DUF3786 domain-containing protein [Alkalibacter mobilis]MBF7096898.1 DUF3786 domain-containing protein [Alkalibacter mobilis]